MTAARIRIGCPAVFFQVCWKQNLGLLTSLWADAHEPLPHVVTNPYNAPFIIEDTVRLCKGGGAFAKMLTSDGKAVHYVLPMIRHKKDLSLIGNV